MTLFTSPNTSMKNFTEAQEFLGKKQIRKIKNNTWAVLLDNGNIGIKLHNTIVVEYFPDGKVRLDSGGWETITTKQRINAYSPVSVYQEKWRWYVSVPGNEKPINFKDGMVLEVT